MTEPSVIPELDYKNIMSLTDSAVGFLTNSAILQKELANPSKQKDLLRYFRLSTVDTTSLLQSIEMFLKVFLLKDGKKLGKLQTHKVYDLFLKLKPEMQHEFAMAVYGDGTQHFAQLVPVLQANNDKLIRFRYNDLNKSAHLSYENGDVLLHFAYIMCKKLGEKVTVDGQEWSWHK
ncbi:MAG: hypothetical protein J6S80_02010 [Alphaproteobacteria bacterium]|nr:hypothetical protein [Alphaproteobacteria bacterium]